jgi:hypothetical protein
MSEFFNHLFGEIFSIICYAFGFALIMWLIRVILKPKAYIRFVRSLDRGYKLAMIVLPILFVLAFLIILPFSIIMHPNEWRAIGENINDHFRHFFSPTLATQTDATQAMPTPSPAPTPEAFYTNEHVRVQTERFQAFGIIRGTVADYAELKAIDGFDARIHGGDVYYVQSAGGWQIADTRDFILRWRQVTSMTRELN